MSHLSNSPELIERCIDGSIQCKSHLSFDATRYQVYGHNGNQQELIVASIFTAFFLIIMMAAFFDPLKKLLAKLFGLTTVIVPILVVEFAALLVSFFISFGACFKQTCSDFESNAWLYISLLGLFVSIPLAYLVNKHRKNNEARAYSISKKALLIISLAGLAVTLTATISALR